MTDDESLRGNVSRVAPTAVTEPALGDEAPGLAPTTPSTRDSLVDVGAEPITLPAPGYQLGDVIGRGGMGEVVAAHDLRIGREVAVKRMRGARPDGPALARFLREARIQARLDHPAIVPVHELGTDEHGRPFFTMKRLRGVTLAERIADGTPQNRLLRAFIDVCHAVELAHARGVVHRDLKPSNIMLGDYGEVYVLDWGVARVITERARAATTPGDVDSLDDGTQTGALLGTPGYMAPEQIKGHPAMPAADVYALGVILFEILVREPLHPRGAPALAHTLSQPQVAPSARSGERAIAPELDDACRDALAEDPEARPTARQLAERVQTYLDGDRDVERRRELAAEQLERARAALACDDRAAAIHAAGRALALDPQSSAAAALVTKLIVEPPTTMPAELAARLESIEQANTRARINKASIAYVSPLLLLPAIPFLHVKSWPWIVVFYVTLVATAASMYLMARWYGRPKLSILMGSLLVGVILVTRLAGFMVITPVMICGVMLALASNPQLVMRPALLIGWGLVSCFVPLALEALGVLATSFRSGADGLLSISTMFASGPREHALLIAGNAIFISVVGLYASHLGRMAATAQHRLHVQAWHLHQLLPSVPTRAS